MTSLTQKLLKKQWFPNSLRILTLLFFIFLILVLYYEVIKLFNNYFTSYWALFIIWTLWWPFLYISVLFFSRVWCGFLCPLGLANEYGDKLRKGKTINMNKWSFLPFVLFFVIVFLEQISGLFLSNTVTLIFFILFFSTAFIFGLLFTRWSFCKYICPIGVLLGVFSRLSFLGLRTQEEKCKVCTTRDCLTGTKAGFCPTFISVPFIKNNKDCLLCTRCIKNCPYDSPDLKLVKPGKEIIDKVNFSLNESLFIIAILGLTFTLNSRGVQFFRQLIFLDLNGWLLRLLDFSLAIGLTIIIFTLLACFMGNLKDNLTKLGYSYLPLVFSIMFFAIVFGFLGPSIKLSVNFVAYIKYALLNIGLIWSVYFSYKLFDKKKFIIILASLLLIFSFWLFYLIPGPLNEVIPSEPVVVLPNETLIIDAYSMGFMPETIIVETDQNVNISIKNMDVVHSFDIDEFNVHQFLMGGKTTNISFIPNKAGEFIYYCNIPGHTEAGMWGKIIVK
ncbi:hypothetical protein COV11_04435 [Candidatus Woesearchaeota archaeon CG10_big_fil_rev_8_21_14_0_10_30_7]|nr:MAG: hypothetical protein COV11_04435 [Candidatus Woesearchaeota archaeon CG10_big_fil_rev_8_21_14_0_10_30_7]